MPPRRSRPVFPGPKVAGYQRRATSGTSACLDHGVVDGREFARIIDRKPQRRSGPIGLGPRQPIGRNHTFDHVGDDRRPRAPFQLDGNRGHTPSEPERAVYTLQPRRRPEPGHHKGAQTSLARQRAAAAVRLVASTIDTLPVGCDSPPAADHSLILTAVCDALGWK